MPTINYNAALPAFSSISGRSSIDINKWVSELKFNISSLIKSLFANNEQGFFYDPNDLSTMFQDAAGTVPVTAAGQPVGLILDKSGRNNHAFQTNSAPRPILRKNAVTGANYLEFDGSDDFLQTNNIDFTGTDKVSLFIGVTGLRNTESIIIEFSANTKTNNGAFNLSTGPYGGAIRYTSLSRGSSTIAANQGALVGTTPPPNTSVLSAKHDISGDLSTIRANAVKGMDGVADKGTGNFGNYPLYIGRRGNTTFPFNGHIYSLIGVGKLVSDNETIAIEKELAKRLGVTL